MPGLHKTHPDINMHVVEMKTARLAEALVRGEIDAAVAVNVGGLPNLKQTVLFYEQFVGYVSRDSNLFGKSRIVVSDLKHEQLWLLEEGHCFRDQLVRFCNLKTAGNSKANYLLGSIETFMRMVERGQGVTFIPELALEQLTERQRELARPFGLPIPVREVVMLTAKNFLRKSLLDIITGAVMSSVPERMLKMNNTEQRI